MLAMLCGRQAGAQDTLKLSLPEAEKQFLQQNLSVLAAQYNVEAQQALELQARLYANPVLSAELNAVNPQDNKYFHVSRQGQKAFALEQLFLLGGKKQKEIALAKGNTALAQQELQDLLRNLKYQLYSSFYGVYFDWQILQKYNTQLGQLDTLIGQFEQQAQKGNVALKDVVRLKTAFIKLNNDKTDLLQSIQSQQRVLQVLLQTNRFVFPDLSNTNWEGLQQLVPLDSLQALAFAHRADWRSTTLQADLAELNTRYQKSLAVPDLNLGLSYDQNGGAFRNQVNLTAAIPLPIRNRNQGNIKAAQIQTALAQNNVQLRQTEIHAEVTEAWSNMRLSIQEFQKVRKLYTSDFTDVINGVNDNFRKRNISLIEFIDFFESYNETLAEISRVRKQLLLSAEQINYTISFPLYK